MIRVIYDESRSGINYEPKYWPFRAERFALTLTERTSQATITVGPDAPDLPVSALLQDDSGPQAGIVWRIKSVNKDYNTNTRTINCEHAINALRDYVAFGEITPADITGNPNATTCSNLDVLHYVMRLPILEHAIGGEVPVPWRFGSVVALVSGAYTFNGDDAYSIVESVSATMHNPWWTYDFSQRPYVLSIVEAPEDKVCELRLDRNMRSLQVTEDRSRMYTRIWPIGRNDLKLPERYLEKNVSTYGVIDHTETNDNMTTEEDLRKWAGERLDYYSEPQLTISVNAMDLSGITGEELDRLKLGCRCSVVLPEYGKTFSQRVVSLRWNDTISDPTNVQITLANVREDVAAIISRQTKKASSGGRSAATTASKSLKDVTLTGPVNNIYSLKKVLNNGQTLPIGDFSRAVTSWSVVASADTLRVTAKPQEQTKVIPLRMGTITRSGNTYKGYVQYSGNDRASWTNTNIQVVVDATAVYTAGRNDTRIGLISWGSAELSQDVTFVASTDAPSPKSRTVDMNVYLTGTTVYVRAKDRESSLWANRLKLDVSSVKNQVGITLFSWGSEDLSADVTVVASTNAPIPSTRTVDMNLYLSGTIVYMRAKDRESQYWANRLKLDVNSVKNLVGIQLFSWGSEALSEDVTMVASTNAPTPSTRTVDMNLYLSGTIVYMREKDRESQYWANRLKLDVNSVKNLVGIQLFSWGSEDLSENVTVVASTNAPVPATRSMDMNLTLSGTIVYMRAKDQDSSMWTNRLKLDVSSVKNLVGIQLFSWGSEELSEDVTMVASTNAPSPSTRSVDMNLYLSGTTVYMRAKDQDSSLWANRLKLDVSSVKNLVGLATPGWGNDPLSEDVDCTVSTIAPSPTSMVINMNLYQSGNDIYMKARYDGEGNWTNRLKITPTLNWSMPSALSTSSTEPSGTFNYSYMVSNSYTWIYWTMTVNGVSKKVKIKLTS